MSSYLGNIGNVDLGIEVSVSSFLLLVSSQRLNALNVSSSLRNVGNVYLAVTVYITDQCFAVGRLVIGRLRRLGRLSRSVEVVPLGSGISLLFVSSVSDLYLIL